MQVCNVQSNNTNIQFGMKFPTRKLVKAEAAPYVFLSDESGYFNKKLNIITVNSRATSAAVRVRDIFREQYTELSKMLQNRYEMLKKTNYPKFEKINLDRKALNEEINTVMKDFNLKSVIDIDV